MKRARYIHDQVCGGIYCAAGRYALWRVQVPCRDVVCLCDLRRCFFAPICLVDEIVVSGRVENAPVKGGVRVQLLYPNHNAGDSAEVTLGPSGLGFPILTQNHAAVLIGTFRKNCDRKPRTGVVTLIEADREYDRVSWIWLGFKKMADSARTLCALDSAARSPSDSVRA